MNLIQNQIGLAHERTTQVDNLEHLHVLDELLHDSYRLPLSRALEQILKPCSE